MHLPVFHLYIPALKITEHKILMIHTGEINTQVFKIFNQFFFIIRNLQRIQEIITEVQQVRNNGLPSKLFRSNTPVVIKINMPFDLHMRQLLQTLLKQSIHMFIVTMLLQFIQQRHITKIFLQINCFIIRYFIDRWYRTTTLFKMCTKL